MTADLAQPTHGLAARPNRHHYVRDGALFKGSRQDAECLFRRFRVVESNLVKYQDAREVNGHFLIAEG